MWQLAAAVVSLSLALNLLRWRSDRRRIARLLATSTSELAVKSISSLPRVSFLVAAWNEESSLQPCLDAILRLHYPELEVVLCAGGTDRTWEIASQASDPRLILLQQLPGEGKRKALQRCLAASSGEILYLLDADCRIDDRAFARVLGPIVDGEECAVTGIPCTPLPEQSDIPFVLSQCASRACTSIYHGEYCFGLSGANSAVRREPLLKAGGFERDARIGVDYDLSKRLLGLGIRIRYRADATFPIKFHTRLKPYLRQQARWLRNVVVLGMRFGNYREAAASVCTSLVGLAMIGTPFLWLMPGIPSLAVKWSGVVWTCAVLHALLSRVRYLMVAAALLGIRIRLGIILRLPLFLSVDFVAWALPLFQYPVRSFRTRW